MTPISTRQLQAKRKRYGKRDKRNFPPAAPRVIPKIKKKFFKKPNETAKSNMWFLDREFPAGRWSHKQTQETIRKGFKLHSDFLSAKICYRFFEGG